MRCSARAVASASGTATFEIGAGTGIATRRLLSLGAKPLTAIEPDRRLADFLRSNNSDPALNVIVSAFENAILEHSAFSLGVSGAVFVLQTDIDSGAIKLMWNRIKAGADVEIESHRVCRRPQLLRGWGYDKQDDESVFS